MKQKYQAWILLLAFGIISISLTLLLTPKRESNDLFERHQLSGLSLSSMVSILENKLDEQNGLSASINGRSLVLSDNEGSEVIHLPDDLFYLSVAPYIDRTHPCTTHNLVTCRGELKNKNFTIQVIDLETNQVIIDEQMTSASNGFIGLWLPKGKVLSVWILYEGYSGYADIETHLSSPTCLTTIQLT